jgi:hypothetical protein
MSRDYDILVCDEERCVYTGYTASRLSSAKSTGIPRCVKHGALLLPRSWAYRLTPDEVRKRLRKTDAHRLEDRR